MCFLAGEYRCAGWHRARADSGTGQAGPSCSTGQSCETWLMQTCSHPHPLHLEGGMGSRRLWPCRDVPAAHRTRLRRAKYHVGGGVAPASSFPPANPSSLPQPVQDKSPADSRAVSQPSDQSLSLLDLSSVIIAVAAASAPSCLLCSSRASQQQDHYSRAFSSSSLA